MARYPYKKETHGSQKDLQILANQFPELLDKKLTELLGENIQLDWKSPLKEDEYAEYVDQSFIDRLGKTTKVPLKTFWPNGGANWDGLATAGNKVFIMEAKAHIEEQKGDESTKAKSPKSIQLIEHSLQKTKDFLGVTSDVSWCKENYYQYANRLAHLYYLRELNGIDAHLLFIYFLNDETVTKNETEANWNTAIDSVYESLDLSKNNKLSKYVHTIFIDVNNFKEKN